MTSTSRIAKNTLFLYFRQILIMLVSLYTVRVVLNVLGAEDYGIYSVVAGVVVLFSFVNNAMASGTQRYLNFYLGQSNGEKVREAYSTSLVIHFFIALLFIVISETAGLWFVGTRLNIPTERHNAAMIVYQFSIAVTVLGILRVPYNAVIIAYERMDFFAYISIVEAALKLAVALLLRIRSIDRLILYAALLAAVSAVILLCYKWYCNRTFETACFRKIQSITLAKEMLSFSGWTLFGAASNVVNAQGTNIVLNMFTSVSVNAAAGIASNVSYAAYSFVQNFQTAFNPQIVKSYAAGERKSFENLVCRAAKCSFYLFFLIALPFYANAEFVLNLWLKSVPTYSAPFVQLILIWLLLEAVSAPLYMAVQTAGNIKCYQIVIGIITIMNLPLAAMAFSQGANPLWMMYIRIALSAVALLVRIAACKKLVSLSMRSFYAEAMLKPFCIAAVSAYMTMQTGRLFYGGWSRLLATCAVSFSATSVLALFAGLKKEERQVLFMKIKRKIS